MALPEIKVRMTSDTGHAEAGVERVTKDLNNLGTAAVRAGRSSVPLGRGMDDLSRRSGNLTRGIQNAAFQVGDFAVQVGGGVQASKALAMQLPQLLGGFGVLGAVAGAAVAILVPMRTALQGMASDGAALEGVFGTLTPAVDALSRGFQAMGEFGLEMAETLINNVDRILITAGVAAAFFGGKWVAGFVAARIATFSLSAALVTLRGALIRTGFGAIIVGAGELVYQFTRLVQAAGGLGEAVGLLGDVFSATWTAILKSVPLLGPAFRGVTKLVMGLWGEMIAWMSQKIGIFLGQFGRRIAGIPGLSDAASKLNQMAADFGSSQMGLYAEADALTQSGGSILSGVSSSVAENFKPVSESITKIRDLLAGMKDDRITLPDILGVGEEDDGGSGGGAKTLKDKLEGQEKEIADHMQRIRALTEGGLRDKLGAWGDYFTNLAALTQSKNQKLIQVGKAFAASQALIDAWVAHNRVLADPTLPWYARIASAAQVLAAGVGAVNAIKSIGENGSGGGASSAATAASSTPAQPTQTVMVNLQGDTFSRASVEGLLEQIQKELDSGGRLVFQ